MIKEKIIEFAKTKIINVNKSSVEDNTIKTTKQYCDLSPYFKAEDTIEFDDSTEAYISIDFDKASIVDVLSKLKVKIIKDGIEVKVNKLPFKASRLIFQCLLSYFTEDTVEM